MSDGFSAVPPPNAGVDPNAALQDALARAKQIAAKLQQGGPTAVAAAIAAQEANTSQDTEASEYRKRALEEAGIGNGEPAMKKPTSDVVQAAPGDPKALAMQVAANIAQKAGLGSMAVEEIRVPNKFVGLIIGRGGEMINKLQSESGARIQVAPDPPPGQTLAERNITITGSPSSVSGAKALIAKICEEGKVPDHLAAAQQPGEFATELMIPASKVGLIIGKGGETIRSLQERAGCRMIMIQDGAYTNAPEKPLRISGDPQKCQYGRSLVQDLLTEKELELQSKGEFGGKMSDYGSQNNQGGPTVEMNVPRDIVGFVIGKQGDTIKKIQAESGCRVQFKIPDPGNTPHRICVLQGDQSCVQKAQALIDDIVSSVSSRQRGGGGGGGGPPSRGPPPNAPGVKTVEFPVVANKCGLVIGKGGETIRTICQVSGAHVEINKSIPESAPMKSFTIRGSDGQIQQAQSMIREKVGDQNIGPQNLYGQQQMGQGGGQMGGQQQGQWGYGYGNMQQQQQQQQQYQQPQQQQYGQSGGQQGAWQQQAYGQYQAPGQQAAQGGQSQAQPGQQASGAQPDYTAAWQAYYQQYYQQYGMQQNTAASGAPAATSAAGGAQAVAGQAAGGQPDYSAWGNYYQQFYPGYQQQQAPQGQQPAAQGGQHPPTS